MRRFNRLLSLTLALVVVLTIFGGVAIAQDELVIVVGIEQEPERINPLTTLAFGSYIESFYGRDLWEWDRERNIHPVMAAEIPSVENGMVTSNEAGNTVVEIRLREGLQWSDGTPITSADCEAWHNVRHNRDLSPTVSRANYPDVVEGFEIVDELTFRIIYAQVYPDYLAGPELPECRYPAHIINPMIEEFGNIDDSPYWDATDNEIVSFGPYKLVARERGVSWTMVPNEYWPAEFTQPVIDRIVLVLIEDDTQMRNAMRVGDIDLSFNWSDDQLTEYSDMAGVEAFAVPGVFTDALWIRSGPNGQDTAPAGAVALQDPLVRQAIAHAIDRITVAEQLIGPGIEVPTSWYPPTLWPEDLPFLEYNVDRARELLDEAGWLDHDGDEGTAAVPTPRQNADGVQLTGLRFGTTENELRNNYQLVIQEYLAQVGIGVEIQIFPASIFFAPFAERGTLTNYEFDLAIFANSADPLTPLGERDSYQCRGIPSAENPDGFNPWQFCNPRYDEVDNLISQTLPGPERDALVEEAVTLHFEGYFWHGLRLRATWFAVNTDRWDISTFENMGSLSGNYFNNSEAWRPAG